jgi:hypothetical protein
MKRMRSMLTQSPAIAIASAALVLSAAGGATAAAVSSRSPAAVTWHNLTMLNGWKTGAFTSFHLSYYLDPNGVVHLRGSARIGNINGAVFQLPSGKGIRPSKILSMVVYTDTGPAEMNIRPNGQAFLFNTGGSNVLDFTSFDGVSFPKG